MRDVAKYALDSARDSALDSAKFDKSEFDILVAKCGKTIGLKGEVKLIIYSDFLEVFTKGNVFLCKGAESSADSANQKNSSLRADSQNLRGNPPIKKGAESQNVCLLRDTRKSYGLPRSHSLARNDNFLDSSLRKCSAQNDKIEAENDNLSARVAESSKKSPQDDDFALDSAIFLTLNSFNPYKNSATFAEITNIDSAKNLTSMLLFSSKSLTKKQCVLGEGEHFWFEIINKSVAEKGEVLGIVSEIERIGSVDYLIIEVEANIFAKYPHIKAKRFYLPYISRYILGAENGVIQAQDALLILENS